MILSHGLLATVVSAEKSAVSLISMPVSFLSTLPAMFVIS